MNKNSGRFLIIVVIEDTDFCDPPNFRYHFCSKYFEVGLRLEKHLLIDDIFFPVTIFLNPKTLKLAIAKNSKTYSTVYKSFVQLTILWFKLGCICAMVKSDNNHANHIPNIWTQCPWHIFPENISQSVKHIFEIQNKYLPENLYLCSNIQNGWNRESG